MKINKCPFCGGEDVDVDSQCGGGRTCGAMSGDMETGVWNTVSEKVYAN